MTRLPSLLPSLGRLGAGLSMPQVPQLPTLSPRRRRRKKTGRRTPAPPQLTSEEESSLLRGTLSTIGWLGETLDKPGAAVRGLLAGKPEQLANLIPFSDTLGITDPKKRVSGRDLLEQAGMLSRNRPGLDWGDVAGFGAEVATDPLTLLTMGPMSKGFKLADKATDLAGAVGKFEKAVEAGVKGSRFGRTMANRAEQIREGSRAVFGLGLPFMKPVATFGEGSRLAPWLMDKMMYGGGGLNPIILGRAMLSPKAGETISGVAQRAKDMKYAERGALMDALTDAKSVVGNRWGELRGKFEKLVDLHGKNGDEFAFNEFGRAMVETKGGLPSAERLTAALGETWKGMDDDVTALGGEMHELFGALLDTENTFYKRMRELGGKGELYEDAFIDHFGRRAHPAVLRKAAAKLKGVDKVQQSRFEYAMGRKNILRDHPGGAVAINRIAMDMVLWGDDPKALKAALAEMGIATKGMTHTARKNLYTQERYIKPELDKALATGVIDEAQHAEHLARFTAGGYKAESVAGRAPTVGVTGDATDDLLRYLKDVPDEVRTEGLYSHRLVDDWFGYMESLLETESTLRTAHHYLAGKGVLKSASEAAEGVSLKEAWKGAGFHERGLEKLVGDRGITTSIDDLILDKRAASVLKTLGQLPKRRFQNAFTEFVDRVQSVYKSYLFLPFAASHVRNLAGGQFNNLIEGKVNPFELLASNWEVMKYAKGTLDDLSVLDAVDLKDLIGGKGYMAQALDADMMAAMMTKPEGGVGHILKGLMPKGWESLDPRGVRGWVTSKMKAEGTQDRVRNVLMEAGERAYAYVEFVNRVGYAQALHKKGFSPSEIVELVKRSQFDYSEVSALHRNVLQRVASFPTWPIKNVPYQFGKLFERPGGMSAQTIRAFGQPSDEPGEDYTPSWMRENLAVPLGGPPEERSFLTGVGLPIEDLNRMIAMGESGPQFGRTAEKMAASLNPLVRGGAELWADKQFWSGRPLSSLWSPTEAAGKKIPAIDRLAHMGPWSRFFSEGRRLVDPRKGLLEKALTATTGLKTSTQDVEMARIRDLEAGQKEILADSPFIAQGTFPYIPARLKEQAPPELKKKIRIASALAQRARKLREKRKK